MATLPPTTDLLASHGLADDADRLREAADLIDPAIQRFTDPDCNEELGSLADALANLADAWDPEGREERDG